MRYFFSLILISYGACASAQQERDTMFKHCPVYITDTVTSNNFFLESQPATLKVDRVKGNLTVVLQQRDQYFTFFFHDNKLKNTKYTIMKGSASNKSRWKPNILSGPGNRFHLLMSVQEQWSPHLIRKRISGI